jgi:hypothetical protein
MSTKTAWLPGLLLLGVCAAGGCNDRRGVRDAAVGDALFLPDAPSLLDAPFPDAEPFDAPRIDATTTPDAQASFDANMDTGPRPPTDAGPRPRPDATTDSPDSPGCGLSVTAMCSGGEMPLVYDGPCGTRAELHVMGQYQPDSDGAVDVTISRRGIPLILSFSSYAPTIWRVSVAPDAVVERVILHGYNAQMVTGLRPGTPVTDRSGPGFEVACAYRWPRDTDGCDTEGLIDSLRRETGLSPSTFAGCYEGSRYDIRE